ncbi:helix-turn-helix domain-containing protein [Nocardioides sp. AN3]
MAIPTVASLCSVLGTHLAPAEGFSATETPISAVHVSELPDPTAYVSGGELLLTTGLTLPTNEIGCEQYVARLVNAGIAAIGIGLGPVYTEPPEPLASACRALDLPLLVVPVPTPFLTVTNAYWSARARSAEQDLQDAVASHRTLIDAAAAPDPAAEVLRRLARVLGGWAASLTPSGAVEQIHPTSLMEQAESLQEEVSRLQVAGVHSAASFATHGQYVALFPLSVEGHVSGFLAVGTTDQLSPSHRRVVQTAVTLLSIDGVRRQQSVSAREATSRSVAALVDLGLVDAARQLAAVMELPVPGREGRVLVARGRDSDAISQVVERWCPDVLPHRVDRTEAWFLLPPTHPRLEELRRALTDRDPTATASISEPVRLEDISRVRARLTVVVRAQQPGDLRLEDELLGGAADLPARIDRFLDEQGEAEVDALVSYLRHRGHWERAARELGVHRNTLRYRLDRAREALGVDLDDPDQAAMLWLLLRRRGVA